MAAKDHSLNAPLRDGGEDQWQDHLVDENESQETALMRADELVHRRRLLTEAMTGLNDRERHIFLERRLQDTPATLEDLSLQYGISRERVRQIEVRSFEKVQKAILDTIEALPTVA
jgi:RNA polymerase sigma-32 factor